jgi:hypothetical protein
MMYADDNFGGLAWGGKPAMVAPCPLKSKEPAQTRRAGTNWFDAAFALVLLAQEKQVFTVCT